MRVMLLITLFFLAGSPARAIEPDEILADPTLEARARAISAQLRCVVCQNQSIDDSDAPLARDLRLLVRERLRTGETDSEVVDFVVDRYGAFVLLKPPFSLSTLILWLAPLLLAGSGIVYLWLSRRNPGHPQTPPPLSNSEAARLRDILKD